ncbi:hypothetical protein F0562_014525 [Nyssa sinensis]|uniref:Uncharacterized protein n=1 Tax=Nyssa sinensis TaxID=561372 RepID=A0A5J4ZQI8_9ASTE|nr:hypothetical protein F0562_014525 [Nyssa sinensis]
MGQSAKQPFRVAGEKGVAVSALVYTQRVREEGKAILDMTHFANLQREGHVDSWLRNSKCEFQHARPSGMGLQERRERIGPEPSTSGPSAAVGVLNEDKCAPQLSVAEIPKEGGVTQVQKVEATSREIVGIKAGCWDHQDSNWIEFYQAETDSDNGSTMPETEEDIVSSDEENL